jgi:hypothetical protein
VRRTRVAEVVRPFLNIVYAFGRELIYDSSLPDDDSAAGDREILESSRGPGSRERYVPLYHLYFISKHNDHIERAEDIHAVDDIHGIEVAASRLEDQSMELWCESRKVRSFEAPSPVLAVRVNAARAALRLDS